MEIPDYWGIKDKRYAVVSIAWTGSGGTTVYFETNNLKEAEDFAKYISLKKPRTDIYISDKAVKGFTGYLATYKKGKKVFHKGSE